MTSSVRSLALTGLAAVAIGLASCSSGVTGVTGAEVAGTVTLDGKPFAGGTIVFAGATDSTTASIQPDGTYRAGNVPLGPVRVAVTSAAQPTGQGRGARPPAVPARYRSGDTSRLQLTVSSGVNTYDIPMTTR